MERVEEYRERRWGSGLGLMGRPVRPVVILVRAGVGSGVVEWVAWSSRAEGRMKRDIVYSVGWSRVGLE